MNYNRIGILIKEKRLEKNLTQKRLADMLYITDRAVSKWERGVSLPDISMLKKISEILDIDLNEMLEVKKSIDKTKNHNVKYLLLIIFILLFIILILLNINNSNNNSIDGCKKELISIYNDNDINVYANCLDKGQINRISLEFRNEFDIEKWFSTLDYVHQYFDGGSIMYENGEYRILKCNTIDGNNDIIVGLLDMEYEDNFCKNDVLLYEKCFYTDIFRVVDILDKYTMDDSSYIFVSLDQFQDNNPVNVKIEKEFIKKLEIGNYYEFKFLYYLPNDYKMNNTYDAFSSYELISILKTEKEGLEQVSTNRCEKLVD